MQKLSRLTFKPDKAKLIRFVRYPGIPIIILTIVAFCAIFAPYIAPYDPNSGSLGSKFIPPYWEEGGSFKHLLVKDNADYTVVKERPLPQNRNILNDQLIHFNGYYALKRCPHILRKVVVWDKEQNRQFDLMTNHLEFMATTISAIYKDRWQIEIFFKALKITHFWTDTS